MKRTAAPTALIWLSLSAMIVVVDQLSKAWVLAHTAFADEIPIIDGFLYRTLLYNKGAAFSFLAEHSGWQRWFFIVLTAVIAGALLVWLARTRRHEWHTALPLALIIGGAFGNLIDRLVHGQVTDFILVYFGNWPYPAFNVADSAITVGAILLVVCSLFAGKPAPSEPA